MAGAIHLARTQAQQDRQIFGMNVAADGFLDALLRYSTQETLYCCAQNAAQFVEFKERASRWGVEPSRCVFIPLDNPDRIAGAGCLVLRDPNIAPLARNRQRTGARGFSLCGVSHSLSTESIIAAIGAYILNPVQPWDALVCTSNTAKSTIEAIWQEWHGHIEARSTDDAVDSASITTRSDRNESLCPVALPVIPLGIDTQDTASRANQALRQQQRMQLRIPDPAVLILAHGRHSYFSKAHPLPLLQAVEQIALRRECQVHLAFYGYFPTERVGDEFRALAKDLCSSATIHFVENSDPDFSDGLWAAADIFVSLADNIQETFGLAPVEAMACGLPVIVSDWNGYRETVRHQTDGFLIPTTAPDAGMGGELAQRYLSEIDTYGHFIGGAAQTTAINRDALISALANLIGNADMRRRMGDAGRRHVKEQFDWSVIIPQYEALWHELERRRAVEDDSDCETNRQSNQPFLPDPFTVFASHPTRRLTAEDRVQMAVSSYEELTALLRHRMNMFTPDILVPPEHLPQLIHAIRVQPGVSIGELAAAHANGNEAQLQRSIGWLLKLGAIRLLDDGPGA